MIFYKLLDDATPQAGNMIKNPMLWMLLGLIVLLFVFSFVSSRKRKKQMEEDAQKKDSMAPGYKVTTIGGIVGTVVSVDSENNQFVLETGPEGNTTQLTFDKQAIYNLTPPEGPKEEVFAEESQEEKAEEPVEENVDETNDVGNAEENLNDAPADDTTPEGDNNNL